MSVSMDAPTFCCAHALVRLRQPTASNSDVAALCARPPCFGVTISVHFVRTQVSVVCVYSALSSG